MNFNPNTYKDKIIEYSKLGLIEINQIGKFTFLNYSRETQYNRKWDNITINCRGLIVDDNWNIVARSFPKFFNHDEEYNMNINLKELNDIKIYEKLDGSLGLLFYDKYEDEWLISTKGSINSEQSIWAKNWYNENKQYFKYLINPEITYVFEIIYNENKIVLNYEKEGLYLLTSFRNFDGVEIPMDDFDYPLKPKIYSFEEFEEMFKTQKDLMFEGFILKYKTNDNNYNRIKFKYEYYKKLHRLKDTTYKSMYEEYVNGYLHRYINDMIQITPDEHYELLDNAKNRLIKYVEGKVDELDFECYKLYRTINMFYCISYDETTDYFYEDNNNKKIKLYNIDLLNDSIGKKIDWYYKYFELFRRKEYKDMLPFLFYYFVGGTLRDKLLYDYFEPEFINENIFKNSETF
jgi:RNA ligase